MKSFVKTASFAASGSASGCVDLEDGIAAGLIIGATWTSNTPITYLASASQSGTFRPVYTDTGIEAVCASVGPAIAIGLIGNNRDAVAPFRFIKLQSGYTASVVAQGTAVDVAVILKRA